MPNFTQEKWRYIEMNNTIVTDGEKYKPIAHLVGCIAFPEDEYKANGRLIAAAPEMYDLLKVWVQIQAQPTLRIAQERAKELLAQIDGKEDGHE